MKQLFIFLFFLFGCQSKQLYLPQSTAAPATVQTIAFGSCNKEWEPQNIWKPILSHQPDLWIWLGDIIYADTEDMQLMRRKYLQVKYQKDYKRLRKRSKVIGIWDDHDYGAGDGGKNYPRKKDSEKLLLDFLDVPPGAEVRQRPGAYQSYTFGSPPRKVKIILLDGRYFRDDLTPTPNGNPRYFPNTDGDILGEQQWEWLGNELANSDAAVHLIASGIQIIPEEQGFEKWANFPKVRERFFHLVDSLQPAGTVLLSGDRHLAELSSIQLEHLPYPLYEITSSGMTHYYESDAPEANHYRTGSLIRSKNFGLLNIEWQSAKPKITIEIRDDKDRLKLVHTLTF